MDSQPPQIHFKHLFLQLSVVSTCQITPSPDSLVILMISDSAQIRLGHIIFIQKYHKGPKDKTRPLGLGVAS